MNHRLPLAAALAALAAPALLPAAPTVSRLTPPSALFTFGDATPPYIARFLPGQRFDLQATVRPDAGQSFTSVRFFVDNVEVTGLQGGLVTTGLVAGLPAGTAVASRRAYSNLAPGVHTLTVTAVQSDTQTVSASGNFEIVALTTGANKARNVILFIGDGMGIAHRTAARIMRHGVQQGKANDRLAMDKMPVTGLVMTSSLNSIITDSSPGASCYSTGNKGNNNQHGVFPDDTNDAFDNPRIESITEFLARTQGRATGIVTTADIFDATPGAFGSHTQNRGAGTGICDQYLDERGATNLTVLMGGGRKWFLPATTLGSARANSTDYVLPADVSAGWGVPAGALDPNRDLLADFQAAGFTYAPTRTALTSAAASATKLLGLFTLSNMNVSLDKIGGRRGTSNVVSQYGFPDQPMLDEMTDAALTVLSRGANGFFLMVEGASIDKQAHNMDSERWILETIEFDRAIERGVAYAQSHPDTLVIVTADHECAGINIIGASRVTNADLQTRAQSGGGAASLRDPVVGTYDLAGFPVYQIAADGFPVTTDVDNKILIGYAANSDRYEDWVTNARPLRDTQQPFNGTRPLNSYPTTPLNRDNAGNFLITGQVPGETAVHTASDIPLSAAGLGAQNFTGVQDNTEVFFRMMQAAVGGVDTAPVLPPANAKAGR